MGDRDPSQPIHSSRADDPTALEAIDRFVLALAERIDELQDREARGDLAGVAARVRALGEEAARTGYEGFAASAAAVEAASAEGATDEARKQLVELTELSRRVRLGHRSAA